MEEDLLDELYGAPFDDFVAVRDALAKRLKADGDKDGAAEVKKLRKPPVPVWAINQLARHHADEVEALLEASDRLGKAQRRALSGAGSGDFKEASKAERDALRRLVDRAGQLLPADSEAMRQRVSDTLLAAAHDDAATELLRAGRLTEELEPAGFGDVSGLELLVADVEPEDEPEPEQEAEPEPEEEAEPEPDPEELARAAAREEAQAAVIAARKKVEAAQAELAEAEERLADLTP